MELRSRGGAGCWPSYAERVTFHNRGSGKWHVNTEGAWTTCNFLG